MLRNTFFLVTSAMTLACAPSTGTSRFAPGEWRLRSVGQSPALPAEVARRPWLRFESDSGRVNGHLGCNRTAGPFTTTGDELRFGALIATRMACADDALNRQEAALAGALQATDHFRVRSDTLELLQGTTTVATFVRMP